MGIKMTLLHIPLENILKETALILGESWEGSLSCFISTTEIRATIYCEELKWRYHLQLHTWNSSMLFQIQRHWNVHRSQEVSNSLNMRKSCTSIWMHLERLNISTASAELLFVPKHTASDLLYFYYRCSSFSSRL